MMEKQSTGAATLLIHMLAKVATNMVVTRTVRGVVPALLRTKVAILLAILYLDSAAAMVKPPSNSIIRGFHIDETTYAAAALASRRRRGSSTVRATRSTTAKKGTSRDVT